MYIKRQWWHNICISSINHPTANINSNACMILFNLMKFAYYLTLNTASRNSRKKNKSRGVKRKTDTDPYPKTQFPPNHSHLPGSTSSRPCVLLFLSKSRPPPLWSNPPEYEWSNQERFREEKRFRLLRMINPPREGERKRNRDVETEKERISILTTQALLRFGACPSFCVGFESVCELSEIFLG